MYILYDIIAISTIESIQQQQLLFNVSAVIRSSHAVQRLTVQLARAISHRNISILL